MLRISEPRVGDSATRQATSGFNSLQNVRRLPYAELVSLTGRCHEFMLKTHQVAKPMVAGVPQTYILIGAVVLFGIGLLSAVKRTRPKDPPAHTSGGRRTDDV